VLPRAASSFSELIAVAGKHLADHGWERLWQRLSGVMNATNTWACRIISLLYNAVFCEL